MKILFYLEPVVFRANPTFFTPLVNCFRCIINSNRREDVTYGLATSPVLLQEYNNWLVHGGLASITRYPIDPTAVLEPYNYDRFAYSRDLFRGETPCLSILEDRLRAIDGDFDPDIVICPTQNTLLQTVFGDNRVLFFERGPLPRWNGRDNFYFDVSGHQANSVLELAFDQIVNSSVLESDAIALAERFAHIHGSLVQTKDAASYFQSWMSEKAAGRKVALIAHQPNDSILVAGGYSAVSPDEFAMRVLHDLPDDWVATASYHPENGDYAAFDAYLETSVANFIAMPIELRQYASDPFAAVIDGVITIGSKAAFPPALLGKKVVAYGQSMLRGFSGSFARDIDDVSVLSAAQSGRLLAFLSNRYTFSFEDCFERDGALLAFWDAYKSSPDKRAFQLDMRDWSPERVNSIFGMTDS